MSYERDCGDSYDSHNNHDQFDKVNQVFSGPCLTRRDGITGSSNLSSALGADLRDHQNWQTSMQCIRLEQMYYLHWKQS